MPLDWTTGELMVPAGCLPCCTPPTPPTPTECMCALFLPVFLTPYANYSDAQTVIANHVTDCLMYSVAADGSGAVLATANIAVTSTIVIDLADTAVNRGQAYISVAMLASENVSIAASVTANGTNPARPAYVNATFSSCDGTELDTGTTTGSETAASDTFVFTAPSDGEYIIGVSGGGAGDATEFTLTDTLTFSGTWTINPVIALWDDSGTTRKLWACPKMLVPILTESSATWYADCTAADAYLTDPDHVSNCVGAYGFSGVAFTATDGGSSLTLAMDAADTSRPIYGGLNLEAGETLSFSLTVTGSSLDTAEANIYDDDGLLVETITGGSSPLVSAPLPYTGRYTVSISITGTGTGWTWSSVITSSGTLSVNQVQALYDVGLTCPARLNCGDTC